jgi:hypothetical protein
MVVMDTMMMMNNINQEGTNTATLGRPNESDLSQAPPPHPTAPCEWLGVARGDLVSALAGLAESGSAKASATAPSLYSFCPFIKEGSSLLSGIFSSFTYART